MVTINPALLVVVLESWLSGETAHALIARTLQSDPTTDPDKTLQQFIEDVTAQVDALKAFKPRADTEGDRMKEGFAGLPFKDQGFAGLPNHLQPSNLPMADTEGDASPAPQEKPAVAFQLDLCRCIAVAIVHDKWCPMYVARPDPPVQP